MYPPIIRPTSKLLESKIDTLRQKLWRQTFLTSSLCWMRKQKWSVDCYLPRCDCTIISWWDAAQIARGFLLFASGTIFYTFIARSSWQYYFLATRHEVTSHRYVCILCRFISLYIFMKFPPTGQNNDYPQIPRPYFGYACTSSEMSDFHAWFSDEM